MNGGADAGPNPAPVATRASSAVLLAPYLAYARLGARQEGDARAALIGRACFLLVILFVFSRIWALVFSSGALAARARPDLLWYIVITELVVLSFPPVHTEMEEDFRTGEFLTRLPLPVSYLGARIAEGAGGTLVRMAVFAPVGAAGAYLLGGAPSQPASLVPALLLAVAATAFALVNAVAVGVGGIWLHDTSPVYWIWQKFTFILGGLLLPLDVYPEWLRALAAWSPFGAMLSGPGSLVFEAGAADIALAVARLAIWSALSIIGLRWLWGRGLRALDGHGG